MLDSAVSKLPKERIELAIRRMKSYPNGHMLVEDLIDDQHILSILYLNNLIQEQGKENSKM